MQILTGMSESNVREAIASPAKSAGLLLEPGLIDLVARDTLDQPGRAAAVALSPDDVAAA